MSEEKKKTSDKDKDKDKSKAEKKKKMDKELRQTFPASDPPSRTRPGHKRTEDDDS